MADRGTPAFYGLEMYADKEWGFEFWFPVDWHKLTFADGRNGIIVAPVADDPGNSFSVEVKNMGVKVSKSYVDDLYAGFIEGLGKLPDCHIDWQDRWVIGALIGLEAKYTFTEAGQTRKRWIRLLYEGKRQFHVIAQGATVEDYAYWEPMLFESMMTLKVY
jgi:hypothetical protein